MVFSGPILNLFVPPSFSSYWAPTGWHPVAYSVANLDLDAIKTAPPTGLDIKNFIIG